MKLSEVSVRQPVTISMLYVLVCVVAMIFVPRLGVALYPSVDQPVFTVGTFWTDVGPEEVEQNVTRVLESRLSVISGHKEMSSTSTLGRSFIRLTFGYDVDLDEASNDIKEVLTNASRSLPDDCDTPLLWHYDANARPIMRLTVSGDMTVSELRVIAEDTVAPLLERIEGVATADVSGGADRIVRVDVNENRLRAYGLTLSGIASALSARNLRASGGSLIDHGVDYEIYLNESFTSLEDIRHTVVSSVSVPSTGANVTRSHVVRLEDVAEVYEMNDYSGSRVYIDGVPGLYISVSNETDSNSTTVARSVRDGLPEINSMLPRGVSLTILSDDTTMISATMGEVYNSAFQGGFRHAHHPPFFAEHEGDDHYRPFHAHFHPGYLARHVAHGTHAQHHDHDRAHSRYRHDRGLVHRGAGQHSPVPRTGRERGRRVHPWKRSGGHGHYRIHHDDALRVLARTHIQGRARNARTDVRRSRGYGGSFTVRFAFCGHDPRSGAEREHPPAAYPPAKTAPVPACTTRRPDNRDGARGSKRTMRKRWPLCCTPPPRHDPCCTGRHSPGQVCLARHELCAGILQRRHGYHHHDTAGGNQPRCHRGNLVAVQDIVKERVNGYSSLILTVGRETGKPSHQSSPLDEQVLTPVKIRELVEKNSRPYRTPYYLFFRTTVPVLVSHRHSTFSEDIASVETVAADIVRILEEHVPEVVDVETDFESGRPQYTMVIDRDRASALGVSVSAVSAEIRAALNGLRATSWQQGNDDIDIMVHLPDPDVASLSDLGRLMVNGKNGSVMLDNLVTFRRSVAPTTITREEGMRINHVTANLRTGLAATQVQPLVEKAVAQHLVLPESVQLSYAGEAQDLGESGSTMIMVVIIAIFLVFIVMAAQFESLVDPFIIFMSIPLLSVGVVWMYAISGQPFSLFSAVGVVALVGIVVNNGIVLVDYTNELVKKKTPVYDACVLAAKNRLRPILMTTLTTVIAMVPMAFFPGEGGEMMQPIGITMVGGLLSGAVMTLFVTPIMYSLFNKRKEKRFDDPESLQNMLAEFDR